MVWARAFIPTTRKGWWTSTALLAIDIKEAAGWPEPGELPVQRSVSPSQVFPREAENGTPSFSAGHLPVPAWDSSLGPGWGASAVIKEHQHQSRARHSDRLKAREGPDARQRLPRNLCFSEAGGEGDKADCGLAALRGWTAAHETGPATNTDPPAWELADY